MSVRFTQMNPEEYQSHQQAKIEHAPGVAVRMNPVTYRIEYYDTKTGKIVSEHI